MSEQKVLNNIRSRVGQPYTPGEFLGWVDDPEAWCQERYVNAPEPVKAQYLKSLAVNPYSAYSPEEPTAPAGVARPGGGRIYPDLGPLPPVPGSRLW